MLAILIPGLILVALMVYASTRIKKTAAAAFDAETVETDDFIIQKPEGFLNKLNRDKTFAFEAYSKEFGVGEAADFRQGSINLTIRDQGTVDDVVTEIKAGDVKITEDLAEVIGPRRYRVIDATRVVKDIDFHVTYKLAEKDGKIYKLEAVRLAETSDEFSRKLDLMVGSFELK